MTVAGGTTDAGWFDALDRDKDGRLWLPDVVAWLWQSLSDGNPAPWRVAYDMGFGPPRSPNEVNDFLGTDGLQWRDKALGERGKIPPTLAREFVQNVENAVTTSGDARERLVGRLRLLVSLDRACDGLALPDRRVVPELADIEQAGILDAQGNLCRVPGILVLARGAPMPTGGASLSHYLENLVVLDKLALGHYRVSARPMPDLCRLARRPSADDNEFVVGFVPTLDAATDVAFRPVGGDGHPRFALELNDAKQRQLIGEARELVRSMEDVGVELALFPETVASPALLEGLRSALSNNYQVKHGNPSLRLALVGRLNPRKNEVVAISGSGQRILTRNYPVGEASSTSL